MHKGESLMYKGYKVTKHLQRYMGYVKNKYERLSLQGEVDVEELLKEYKLIMDAPRCIQLFIIDWISGETNNGYYKIVKYIDGGVYVRENYDVKKAKK